MILNKIEQQQNIAQRLRNGNISIDGISVKDICSNVRTLEVPWDSVHLKSGLGKEGNLVLVEVLTDQGSRKLLENQQGFNRRLYRGDKFIGVLANRHSGTEESGDVPEQGIEIHPGTELHLLSTSGLIGLKTGIPSTMQHGLLTLKAHGLLSRGETLLDLMDLCGPQSSSLNSSAPIILVCGTCSDVGKTTTSASLIRQCSELGMRVAATKISGTGNMQDAFLLRDAGASSWLEFPDIGLPSTYTNPERYTKGIHTLFNLINSTSPEVIVAEAGGDPTEANVPTFLADAELMQAVKAIIIVPGDVMGMIGTITYLRPFLTHQRIFLTDPKERNSFTTRKRVNDVLPGFELFNSLDPNETQKVIKRIFNQ